MKRLAPPTAAPEGNGRTAFVLSGGGSLGAVQVGMLQALTEAGIRPDLLIGTSVGAGNAAWIGGKPHPQGALVLREGWRGPPRPRNFSPMPPGPAPPPFGRPPPNHSHSRPRVGD